MRKKGINMSKKIETKKKLRKGRFYTVHDGSETGHPGMIYWKNDNKNLYLSLLTGTSSTKDNKSLTEPTDCSIDESFIHRKPFLGKRKDYGNKELKGMSFSKIDKKKILRPISKKEPRLSKNINRKDKRFMKKLRRQKIPKY